MPPMTERQEPEGWGGVSQSDWAGLHHRVGTLEASVRVVANGHALLVDQVAEMTVARQLSDKRLDKLDQDLQDNTGMSREIRGDIKSLHDVIVTARTTGKFARWLAPSLGAAAIVIAIVQGWVHDVIKWFTK